MLSSIVGEAHRIRCPYCLIGGAVIVTHPKKDGVDLPLRDPVQCDNCRRYFELYVKLRVYGKRIESEAQRRPLEEAHGH